ncbi:MAG: TfoX/Sxy family protein [Oleiphilaceae bacterium]|nr:TfoX/Sxy family protein [Oleiphilaceae bacterium]
MGELSKLKGLGPKSEQQLNAIGIHTEAQLRELGAVGAFMRLREQGGFKPSLNFLYALVGALNDQHWIDVAQQERERLLADLEGYEELKALFKAEGIEFD